MTRVGILTDHYSRRKVDSLVDWLENQAGVKVQLLIEEEVIFRLSEMRYDMDVCFVKGKGELLLTIARDIESQGIPTINSTRAINVCSHRFMNSYVLQKAGVSVPDFAIGRAADLGFSPYIAKNIIDYDTDPYQPIVSGRSDGPRFPDDDLHYFQRYIDSHYEYKVYGLGDQLLFYRQLPTLLHPAKMETRVPIDPIPALQEMSHRAMSAIGLSVCSIDYLQEDGRFFLTDINSVPNFNYIEGGPELVGRLVLAHASGC